jgi:hypothetical protein
MRALQMPQLGQRIDAALQAGLVALVMEGLLAVHCAHPMAKGPTSLQPRGGLQVER